MKALAAIAVALFSTAALSQQPPAQPNMPSQEQVDRMFFQQFDSNQDGKVSQQEFVQPRIDQFRFMDRNQDGIVELEEVNAFTTLLLQGKTPGR